jgi:hypothetical protein
VSTQKPSTSTPRTTAAIAPASSYQLDPESPVPRRLAYRELLAQRHPPRASGSWRGSGLAGVGLYSAARR